MAARTTSRFIALPLSTAPLLVIVIFSALLFLAAKAGLFGIWLGLLLLTGFFNYSFILLDSVIDDAAEPPVLAVEMMNPVSGQRSLLLLVLLIIVFFASRAGTYWFGPWLAALGALASAVVLPAMLAVQAVSGSTLQALNLVTAVRLIRRLGSEYAMIVGFVVAAALIGSWLNTRGLPLILQIVIAMYLWLASFSLIGCVLRDRSDDLRLEDAWEPDTIDVDHSPQEARTRAQLIDRIYAEWRGGAHENAWKTVTGEIEQAHDPLAELERLYEGIARWPDPRLANRLARELLPKLLAVRRNGEALDLVRVRLKTDPDFRPQSSGDLLHLAGLARDAGDRPTARALLRDFERFYPQDPAQAAAMSLTQQLER